MCKMHLAVDAHDMPRSESFFCNSGIRKIQLDLNGNFHGCFFQQPFQFQQVVFVLTICAFAVLTSTLGTAAYLGEYTIPEGRGFLYSLTDGSQVLVLWKSSDIDSGKKNITFHQDSKNIELPLPSGNYILRSFFGADRKLFASENKVLLQLTTLPAYLCLPQNVKLMPTKEVVKVRSPGISEFPDIDKSIVIRLVPQQGFSMQRNTFSLLKVISENRLKLEIYNFSKIRKRGRLISSIPLKGLPKEIIVESEGRTDCYTQVVPGEGKSAPLP